MAAYKWIGGFLGGITLGPLGALAGFALGAVIDNINKADIQEATDARHSSSYTDQNESTQWQSTTSRLHNDEGQRNSFRFSLLVVMSYIIRADNRIMHSEMNLVRQFMKQNFGEEAMHEGEQILLRLFEREKQMTPYEYERTIYQCCRQIAQIMPIEQRLLLLNYLVEIAKADGIADSSEVSALQKVTQWLSLTIADLNAMLHLEGNDLDSAYRVLGIEPTATNDEVRSAYRRMALKHHPDRVTALGEEARRAAEKKFQEINAAKERIYKARGL